MEQRIKTPFWYTVVPLIGIVIGATIAAAPYLSLLITRSGISMPAVSSLLLAAALLLVLAAGIPTAVWAIGKLRTLDLADSFTYFAPIFIMIFIAGFKVSLSPKILILYMVCFVIYGLRGRIPEIVATPFLYFVVLHLAFCNISLMSTAIIAPVPTYSKLLEINMKLLLVFLVLNAVRTSWDYNRFLWIYIAMCIFTSLVALGQVGIYFATGVNYSFAAPFINRVFYTPVGGFPRITAFFEHPNILGTDISPLFMMLAYFVITPGLLLRKHQRLAIATLLFMLVPLFFSCSRGTWVAMAFGFLLVFFLVKPNLVIHKVLLMMIAVLLFWLTGVLEFAYQFLVSINEYSVTARYGLFMLGLQAMKTNPLIGYGWGNFDQYTGNVWALSVHSFPFQVFTETGAFGFLTYMGMIGYIMWRILHQLRRTRTGTGRIVLEAYLVAFVTLLINNMFHQVAWSNFTFIFITAGEAIARIVRSRESTGSEMVLLRPESDS